MTPKIPPNFPEGERALLGACILDNSIVHEVITGLEEGQFYVGSHRHVFKAITELSRRDVPIDIVSLTMSLTQSGKFQQCGGSDFLCGLIDGVPSAANWRHYAGKIQEYSDLRQLIHGTLKLNEDCYRPEANPKLITQELQTLAFSTLRRTQTKKLTDVGVTIGPFVESLQNGGETGFLSGISTLDKIVRGFPKGRSIGIAARPSVGKTALSGNIMANISQSELVAFFSLEMCEDELLLRLLSSTSGIDSEKIMEGGLEDFELERIYEAQRKIEALSLFIDDTPDLTTSQIKAKVKELSVREGVDVGAVFVDHIGLVTPDNPKDSEVAQSGQITRDFKIMAKSLDVAVFQLIQLNRNLESRPLRDKGRMPRLADLRGSGKIEENLDIAIGLYRPSIYEGEMTESQRQKAHNRAIANVMKRRNGKIGLAHMTWDGPTTTFKSEVSEEMAKHYMEGM